MHNKMGLILKLLLGVFIELILYIFLHEGGHALVAVLCGAKINSFSIIGAHTSSTGGSYTQATSSLLHIAGMLLPIIFSLCYILFCFNKNREGEVYRIFSMFFSLVPIFSLLAWLFVPIAFLAGDTTNPDDVIQFLNVSGIHPIIVMSFSAALFFSLALLAWKKGIIQIWLDLALRNRNPRMGGLTITDLPPWECLMKRMVWQQLGEIKDKKILDFGSGIGVTANHFAENNDVTAIEPSEESVNERWIDNQYRQIIGSTDELRKFADESFDMIICHNVLEYVTNREEILKEFSRVLKPEGKISIVKHNRAGRVMQMVVLLNDFEHAHSLLDGNDGMASKFGTIRYYEDSDIESWCPELKITKTLGMRTFWDMQQNQEIHKDADWQDKMVEIEMRVSDIDEYKAIAFFHHLMLEKV